MKNRIFANLGMTALIGGSVLGSSLVSATVLTFDGVSAGQFEELSQAYGDNVSSTENSAGSYLEGNGFTPNVTVSYRTVDEEGNVVADSVFVESTGFGNLINATFPGQNNSFGEITLTPIAGYQVTLNSFDIAARTQVVLDALQVVGADDSVLWDSGADTVSVGGSDQYTPAITSDEALTLRWGSNWNIAIDNINFDQQPVSAVPVPAAVWFLGSGLLALLGIRRRSA